MRPLRKLICYEGRSDFRTACPSGRGRLQWRDRAGFSPASSLRN